MSQNPLQKKQRMIRDREIYKLYWGSGLTYREIAKKYKISFERIRQIIKSKEEENHE